MIVIFKRRLFLNANVNLGYKLSCLRFRRLVSNYYINVSCLTFSVLVLSSSFCCGNFFLYWFCFHEWLLLLKIIIFISLVANQFHFYYYGNVYTYVHICGYYNKYFKSNDLYSGIFLVLVPVPSFLDVGIFKLDTY